MDKQIKAIFREEARRIVSKDRSARKNGFANNMPGDITTALVTAYKMGLEHANNPPAPDELLPTNSHSIAWEMIPPTSRNVLEMLTANYSRRYGNPSFILRELRGYIDDKTGRPRWKFARPDGQPTASDYSVADKGIGPLLRLGLLAPKNDDQEHLVLTEKGDATCRVYWNRSDRNDPTLPVIGKGR